jgi:transposase-like protein
LNDGDHANNEVQLPENDSVEEADSEDSEDPDFDEDAWDNEEEKDSIARHHRRYTFELRLKYLEAYIEIDTNNNQPYRSDTQIAVELAKKYDVKAETGRHWIKTYKKNNKYLDELRSKCLSSKTRNGTGILSRQCLKLSYPQELDFEILDYVYIKLQNFLPLSRADVKAFALELITPVQPKFKASDRWVMGFQQRHGLSLRSPTDKAPQQLGKNWEKKIMDFTKALFEYKDAFKIKNEYIINMDETPVFHEYLNRKILSQKGQRRVESFKFGKEKKKTSLILTITANGGMLARR